MITVISTLPHYLAAIYAPYKSIVIISSTLSILWHLQHESKGILFILDYIFALVWTLAELYYSKNIPITLVANGVVFGLNIYTNSLKPYAYCHSIWHLISAGKCILIAKYNSPT